MQQYFASAMGRLPNTIRTPQTTIWSCAPYSPSVLWSRGLLGREDLVSPKFVSSAAIALIVCIALIQLSKFANLVNGMPWQYFYKDDSIVVFQIIAPATIAILSGILALIPERNASS